MRFFFFAAMAFLILVLGRLFFGGPLNIDSIKPLITSRAPGIRDCHLWLSWPFLQPLSFTISNIRAMGFSCQWLTCSISWGMSEERKPNIPFTPFCATIQAKNAIIDLEKIQQTSEDTEIDWQKILNHYASWIAAFPLKARKVTILFSGGGYRWRYSDLYGSISWKTYQKNQKNSWEKIKNSSGFLGTAFVEQKKTTQNSASSPDTPIAMQQKKVCSVPRGSKALERPHPKKNEKKPTAHLSIVLQKDSFFLEGRLEDILFRAPISPSRLLPFAPKTVASPREAAWKPQKKWLAQKTRASLKINGHISAQGCWNSKGHWTSGFVKGRNDALFVFGVVPLNLDIQWAGKPFQEGGQVAIDIKSNNSLEMRALHLLWAPAWAPEGRKWVLEHLSRGTLGPAFCQILLTRNAQAPFPNKTPNGNQGKIEPILVNTKTPHTIAEKKNNPWYLDRIKGRVSLHNTFMTLWENISPIFMEDATVSFNQQGLCIAVSKGTFSKNALNAKALIVFPQRQWIECPNFQHSADNVGGQWPQSLCQFSQLPIFLPGSHSSNPHPRLCFDAHLKGPFVPLLATLLNITKSQKLPLNITHGQGQTCVMGHFPLTSHLDPKNIEIILNSRVTGAKASLAAGERLLSFTEGNFSLGVRNQETPKISGTCLTDSFPTSWSWGKEGLKFYANITPLYLGSWIGLNLDPHISGPRIPIKGRYGSPKDPTVEKKLFIDLDLDKNTVVFAPFSWHKNPGTPLALSITKEFSSGTGANTQSSLWATLSGALKGSLFYNGKNSLEELWEINITNPGFWVSYTLSKGQRRFFVDANTIIWNPQWSKIWSKVGAKTPDSFSKNTRNPEKDLFKFLIQGRCKKILFPKMAMVNSALTLEGKCSTLPPFGDLKKWKWRNGSLSGNFIHVPKTKTRGWMQRLVSVPGKGMRFLGEALWTVVKGVFGGRLMEKPEPLKRSRKKIGYGVAGIAPGNENNGVRIGIDMVQFGPLLEELGLMPLDAYSLHVAALYQEHLCKGYAALHHFNTHDFALGKILALISPILFTEFFSSGLTFYKVSSYFSYEKGLLTLNRTMAENLNIGFLLKGSINTRGQLLNLEGVATPAYFFNKFISHFPVFGWIFAKNQGFLSSEFSVKGSVKKPQVSWRPLTLLKLGIIKRLMDDK